MHWMWVFLIGLIVFEAVADIFAKKFGLTFDMKFMFLSILFYIICNVSWLFSMKHGMKLWEGSIVFSISSAILGTIIGHFMGETISTKQWIAIVCGMVSILFMES